MFVHTAVVLFMDLSMEEYINARRRCSIWNNTEYRFRGSQLYGQITKCTVRGDENQMYVKN